MTALKHLLLALYLVSLFFTNSVLAKTNDAQSIDKIQIVTEQFPPFNYRVNGVLKGASLEIMQEMLKELSLSRPIGVYPWARAYEMTKNIPNTLLFSTAKTANRAPLFQWSKALVPVESCFFALKIRNDITVNTIEDAYNYRVTTQKEGNTHHILKNLDFQDGKNLFGSVSIESSYQSLLTGRIDLWGIPTEAVKNIMRRPQNQHNEKLKKVFCFDVSYLYMAFNEQTPQSTIDKFDEALTKIKQDGRYQKILTKYKL